MRVIVSGDEHGRGKFKKIYESLKDDKSIGMFVCEGDYFDPYFSLEKDETCAEIVQNFEDIVKIARSDPRVKLLIGNHDFHYIVNCDKSRYAYFMAETYRRLFVENVDLLNFVVMPNKHTIISHAGITDVWLKERSYELDKINGELPRIIDGEIIGAAFFYDDRDYSGHGESPTQGCTWVRPNGLVSPESWIDGIDTQIVGHTTTQNISYFLREAKQSNDPIKYSPDDKHFFYFADTGDSESYLDITLEDN